MLFISALSLIIFYDHFQSLKPSHHALQQTLRGKVGPWRTKTNHFSGTGSSSSASEHRFTEHRNSNQSRKALSKIPTTNMRSTCYFCYLCVSKVHLSSLNHALLLLLQFSGRSLVLSIYSSPGCLLSFSKSVFIFKC